MLLDRQATLQWACSLVFFNRFSDLTQRHIFANFRIGPSASIPDDCISSVFRALIEEGEYAKAKKLVSTYGDDASPFLDELMQGLVASGELGSALEISQGNLSQCSDEMRNIVELLGGTGPCETQRAHGKVETSADISEDVTMQEFRD